MAGSRASDLADAPAAPRVMVVGAGTRFLSGISYYTHRLALCLAPSNQVSVLLMRRLLPARLYPGRSRVGEALATLTYPAGVEVYDGLDWTWGRSLLGALRFMRRQRPQVVVLQWWTGTVLHSYLLLALVARRLGARVVLEVHEAQDVGELGVPLAASYVKRVFPVLLRRCSAVVVHSAFDRALVDEHFGLAGASVTVIPHGPYTSLSPGRPATDSDVISESGVTRLLFFGVIRPFKGLEDLLEAFAMLSEAEAAAYRLTVVGETWEGWTRPAELIATHPHRDRIDFHNRYVDDAEVAAFFAATDGVVLPYHRSSSSGPLSMAIGHGLPVIVTRVGGLEEAASGYTGAVLVPPRSPSALRDALPDLVARTGMTHEQPATWELTSERYSVLFGELLAMP